MCRLFRIMKLKMTTTNMFFRVVKTKGSSLATNIFEANIENPETTEVIRAKYIPFFIYYLIY